MKAIELPVLFNNEYTRELDKLEIDYSLSDCEVRVGVFTRIDAMFPYEDKESGRFFTELHLGSSVFICTLSYDELIPVLKDAGILEIIQYDRGEQKKATDS
jgi:hypothetical protein